MSNDDDLWRLLVKHAEQRVRRDPDESDYAFLQRVIGRATPEGSRSMNSDGWLNAVIAWEVCASIHRKYANAEPDFTARQASLMQKADLARRQGIDGVPGAGNTVDGGM